MTSLTQGIRASCLPIWDTSRMKQLSAGSPPYSINTPNAWACLPYTIISKPIFPYGVPGGRALQKAVLAQCPNVYLVLSGHRYNVAAVPVSFDDDGDGTAERTVYQMIANYQAAGSEGGSGYMRFLQIDEAAGELRAYSYSPYLEDYRYWDEPGTENEKYPVDPANEEITLPLPWA